MRARLRSAPRIGALVLLAASVHACSSDSATRPDDVEPATLSGVLAEAFEPGISALGVTAMPVADPATSRFSSSSCTYDPASQRFVCARFSAPGGLTIDRYFILYDAAGNTQQQFSSTTATVRTRTHALGTMTFGSDTDTLDVVDDRTVSGLLTARHVLNGTSTTRIIGTNTLSTPPTLYSSTDVMTIANLVLPPKHGGWPGPGTMTVEGTRSFGSGPSMQTHLLAVFTGTKCVTMTFSIGGTSQISAIDLSTGAPGCTP